MITPREHGYLAMSGQIADASIVVAPKQRNTDAEKDVLKQGRVPEDWKDKPAKLAQQDQDARWTMKRGRVRRLEGRRPKAPEFMVTAFGYKNHVSTDRRHGLIHKWTVTDAAANDGRRLAEVIDRTLPLAFLAPDIVTAIVEGRQPVGLTVTTLKRIDELPIRWHEQRATLGFARVS